MKHILIMLLLVCSIPAMARGNNFDRGIEQKTFIPKGQWMVGASFSYSEHTDDNFKWLVMDDVTSTGYTFKVSPVVSYFIRDNIAIGGRVAYSRGLTDLGNLSLNLGDDLSFDLSNYKDKSHTVSGSFFIRTYLNLGDSKRFGLFNEARVTYGYGQSNVEDGTGDELKGTHQIKQNLNFGVAPGITCFVNNYVAVEAAIDVLGLDFKWYDQKTNQVETGKRTNSGANFKINLLSINLGITFYI
mgnify:FL=1